MSMRRFVAPTARDCLRKVKEELGADAIVVSNKPVPGGVEILAMTSEGFELLSRQLPTRAPTSDAAVAASVPRQNPLGNVAAQRAYASPQTVGGQQASARVIAGEDDYTVSLSAQRYRPPQARHEWPQPVADVTSSQGAQKMPEIPAAQEKSRLRPLPGREPQPQSQRQTQAQTMPSAAAVHTVGERPAAAMPDARLRAQCGMSASATDFLPEQYEPMQQQVSELMGEMHTIRALLERQLAGFAWGEMSRESPVRTMALAEMLDVGFSGQLARKLCQEIPPDLNFEDARKWLKSALNRRLRTLNNDNDIIDRGGVFALVGPTGVGKTTTTAKLAARCVVRYGADKLALLTTDGYRIGAHEQLRIYGRILGVPVHVVRDGDDLRHTLADLRDKHMVLIDTVGMSQRDRMVAEQAAMLMRSGEVNRLLLLNATSRGDTLDDVVRAYAGEDLAGVILSKVDETASLAPALDAVIRHGLLLCYIANGQRVPEDMHLPNRNYLLHRAFKLPGEASPHHLQTQEAGLVMTAPVQKVAGGDLRG
ncbi:MAG: flagellar biosynthesis protein FlhF [Sterolibacterium sp.]|nr:flagellar biosynthesis protein FlhF [Sterolibacterium sp.]